MSCWCKSDNFRGLVVRALDPVNRFDSFEFYWPAGNEHRAFFCSLVCLILKVHWIKQQKSLRRSAWGWAFLFAFWFLWISSKETVRWKGWHNNAYLIAFFFMWRHHVCCQKRLLISHWDSRTMSWAETNSALLCDCVGVVLLMTLVSHPPYY